MLFRSRAAKVAMLPLIRVSVVVFFSGISLFLEARSAQSPKGLENLFSLDFLWLLETPESILRQFSCFITTVFVASLLGVILVAVVSIYRQFRRNRNKISYR